MDAFILFDPENVDAEVLALLSEAERAQLADPEVQAALRDLARRFAGDVDVKTVNLELFKYAMEIKNKKDERERVAREKALKTAKLKEQRQEGGGEGVSWINGKRDLTTVGVLVNAVVVLTLAFFWFFVVSG